MVNQKARIAIAVIPVAVLVALLAADISIFGADSILGASQVALMLAGGVCIGLSAAFYKTPWKQFEDAMKSHVGEVASAIISGAYFGDKISPPSPSPWSYSPSSDSHTKAPTAA